MAFTSTRALQAASGLGGEYTIDQSLRFEDGSSAYLSRTPASAGNRKTWTWSGWVKKSSGNTSTGNQLFGYQRLNSSNRDSFAFSGSERLQYQLRVGGTVKCAGETDAVLRDASAWYHIVMSFDIDNATQNDRVKIYVNGEQKSITFSTAPVQSTDSFINSAVQHRMGVSTDASDYLDGYMAEVHFIDGQALDPSYFGETDETYGHWKPIAYTGSYGTNGFYLSFQGTFYNDASGNGNNWTANNLATTDVVLDSPTNNFCTLNPLVKVLGSPTYSEGNLQFNGGSGSGDDIYHGSMGTGSSGKWYFECCPKTLSGSNVFLVGASYGTGTNGAEGAYNADGRIFNQSVSVVDTVATYTTGDIIGIAIDVDNGTINYYKNNSLQGSSSFTAGSNMFPSGRDNSFNVEQVVFNFGQDSSFAGQLTAQNNTDANGYGDFYYTPPSGFLALCTANLSDPAVIPGENFNTVTYTGAGTPTVVTGVGFQPDLGWFANRAGDNHPVYDALRGTNRIYTNLTAAESSGSFSSWDSDGFTVNADGEIGDSGGNYVAWLWKANNTSGSSNTDGSITSTVAANVDAGFSIVSYTGTGSNATVGHGLSSAPEMVIVKNRTSASTYWCITTKDIQDTYGNSYILLLPLTNAVSSNSTVFNATQPTSSVFSIGTNGGTNTSGNNYIAYCFHSVDGYSKFGSYTGNGSTDGPFCYTGFKPKYIMVKATNSSYSWYIWDAARDTYNVANDFLTADTSDAETNTVGDFDLLSNGFKCRRNAGAYNTSGNSYIFMAFAEYPFKYSNAR